MKKNMEKYSDIQIKWMIHFLDIYHKFSWCSTFKFMEENDIQPLSSLDGGTADR